MFLKIIKANNYIYLLGILSLFKKCGISYHILETQQMSGPFPS